ncbi:MULTISPECIES: LysR family transcriptional regulator [unclassified Streptomyces]|uniref:LysR family transcriptional regulator n=1 Tax=unclassified Streptomyces TaxID=2593676 RepID=UPI002ED32BC6|nr:LysR family transcriptional regulator [Streptomyces sp. NBC_00891]WSY04653.1 LysR family transcriptional regulator [Streptomyces sp. NBC_00890]WSZ06278.1 LysR family transcriptional regulator [Streptomyces sp. NBC_00869]WSZ26226.1 LysR family transcriptional regulator [Streptomyces sp. NBC_00870]
MEIRQLRHFMAVVTHGSFTAAARAELIVQSALSTSVRNLERELGAELFDRTGRQVVLTEAGRALLPAARTVLAGTDAARDAVASVSGLATGRVRVGTIQTLTCVDLAAELAAFHGRWPGVQISLREATTPELVAGVRAGELDLAFLAPDAAALPEGLTAFATWHEDLVLITAPGHPLATAGRTLIKDLADEPFVDFRAGTGLETAVRRLAAHCGLERRITCDVTQIRLLVDLVRAGIGVAIVPRRIGEDAGLPCVTIRQPEPGRTVLLVGRAPRPRNPAAEALLGQLCGEEPAFATV